jgi:glucose-1-phosphate adenylyltransferase
MDLCGLVPSLNLYNRRWPIRTASYPDPSAKFTFDEDGQPGQAVGSIISGGCILSGGAVRGSVLGRGVNTKSGCVIEDSIVLDSCVVGRRCKIRRAILDENVTVHDGESIGHDLELDRTRHHVTDTGIVVVTSSSAGDNSPCSQRQKLRQQSNPAQLLM